MATTVEAQIIPVAMKRKADIVTCRITCTSMENAMLGGLCYSCRLGGLKQTWSVRSMQDVGITSVAMMATQSQ
jgi:hypothetical protein